MSLSPTATVSQFREPEFVSRQVAENRRYYLNLQPAPCSEITVVCGGCERCGKDYVVRRSDFPFLAVEFVAEGEGQLTLNGRNYRLRPGMAFWYGPGISHIIRNDPGSPMLKYYVDFTGTTAERLLAESPLAGGQAAQVSNPQDISEIFEQLHRNSSSDSPFSPRLCAALIPLLLLKISERAIPSGSVDTRALRSYQKAKSYLEKHFIQIKTLEEAARACHMDLSYLCRLFQRFDHLSAYQYLLRLKMNHAAELILDSGLLVKEVAARLEFSDACNFSRSFKKVFGLSPERFAQRSGRGIPKSPPLR